MHLKRSNKLSKTSAFNQNDISVVTNLTKVIYLKQLIQKMLKELIAMFFRAWIYLYFNYLISLYN